LHSRGDITGFKDDCGSEGQGMGGKNERLNHVENYLCKTFLAPPGVLLKYKIDGDTF